MEDQARSGGQIRPTEEERQRGVEAMKLGGDLLGVVLGDHVVEIGAGLGSLTLALADTGADITAIEVDRGIVPILRDVVRTSGRVGLLSAAAFVWFSTRLFGTLRSVLVRVFELGQGRGIVVGKLYDVGYTLVSSVLIIAYLTLSAYMAIMRGQGSAALIATHNVALARQMDRVVTLHDGRLA